MQKMQIQFGPDHKVDKTLKTIKILCFRYQKTWLFTLFAHHCAAIDDIIKKNKKNMYITNPHCQFCFKTANKNITVG